MQELLLPENRADVGGRAGLSTPHGTRRQIPIRHRGKAIISSIRCPLDRCLSLYMYGDWKSDDQLPDKREEIAGLFPSYPALTIDEFIRYMHRYYSGSVQVAGESFELGPQSADFLSFFSLCSDSGSGLFSFETWKELELTLNEVTFLDSKDINRQLFSTLMRVGYNPRDIDFVLSMKPVNESRAAGPSPALNEESRRKIEASEWLLQAWFQKATQHIAVDLGEVAAVNRTQRFSKRH